MPTRGPWKYTAHSAHVRDASSARLSSDLYGSWSRPRALFAWCCSTIHTIALVVFDFPPPTPYSDAGDRWLMEWVIVNAVVRWSTYTRSTGSRERMFFGGKGSFMLRACDSIAIRWRLDSCVARLTIRYTHSLRSIIGRCSKASMHTLYSAIWFALGAEANCEWIWDVNISSRIPLIAFNWFSEIKFTAKELDDWWLGVLLIFGCYVFVSVRIPLISD